MKRPRIAVVFLLALGFSLRMSAEGQERMRFFKGGELQKLEMTTAIDDDSRRAVMTGSVEGESPNRLRHVPFSSYLFKEGTEQEQAYSVP
jgi:hypothetical protein